MIVVKVGGSLYDLADLRTRLRDFLFSLADPVWLLVPGGGATADVIRAFDHTHGLGPERSHWLALRACTLNAHFLRELLPEAELCSDPVKCSSPAILDPLAFITADEGQPGQLPHHWQATSDSVAVRAAALARAPLILLKSVSLPPGSSWEELAALGFVDFTVPELIRRFGVNVTAINLRSGESAR